MVNYTNSLSALSSLDAVMQVSTNNLANINTNSYKANRVNLETGPHGDSVRVGSISRDVSSGPALIANNSLREELVAENQPEQNLTDRANSDSILSRQESAKNITSNNFIGNGDVRSDGFVEGSNTDVANEFTTMIATEDAYAANVEVTRTIDDMSGVLLDIKI